jgi:hypothetical protein
LFDVDSSYRYIERYSGFLYPDFKQNVKCCSYIICNDSFHTLASVLYSSKSIAMACIIMAAEKFKYPLPYESEKLNQEEMLRVYK